MHTLDKLARVGVLAIAAIGLLALLPAIGDFIARAVRRVFKRSRPI